VNAASVKTNGRIMRLALDLDLMPEHK